MKKLTSAKLAISASKTVHLTTLLKSEPEASTIALRFSNT